MIIFFVFPSESRRRQSKVFSTPVFCSQKNGNTRAPEKVIFGRASVTAGSTKPDRLHSAACSLVGEKATGMKRTCMNGVPQAPRATRVGGLVCVEPASRMTDQGRAKERNGLPACRLCASSPQGWQALWAWGTPLIKSVGEGVAFSPTRRMQPHRVSSR